MVSPDGRDGSLRMSQDALLYGTVLDANDTVTHTPAAGRKTYVHVARGAVQMGEQMLQSGDAAAIEAVASVIIKGQDRAEVLLFDLP